MLKSYWVPLISGKKELSKENFREGWDKRGFTNKPRGGLFTSLWHPEWGPEWGLFWVFHYCSPEARDLELPVWEVDLRGWKVERAGKERPDFEAFKGGKWDALLIDPASLEEEWESLPTAEKWWLGWDVRTVWIPKWPEERVRFLGKLGEVAPREAVERYLKVAQRFGSILDEDSNTRRWEAVF